MQTARLVIFSFLIGFVSACANFYSGPSAQSDEPAIATTEIDFTSLVRIPEVQSGFDIGFGFAVFSNGDIVASGGWNTRGDHLYRWSRSDRTWHHIKLPSTGGMNVGAKVFFKDSRNGWIFKDRDLLQSRDGGETWISVPLESKSEITRSEAMTFIDSRVGFIGGTTGFMNRDTFEPERGIEILCTIDGGKQFHVCFKSKAHQNVFEILDLKQTNTVVALIDGNHLFATQNGGKDWTKKALPKSAIAAAVDNESRIWIVGNTGTLLCSRDLGESWAKPNIDLENASQVNWNSIAFSDKGVGIAVGNGGLFAISENGQDWRITKPERIDEDLYDIQIRGSYVAVRGKENLYSIRIR
ncbi:MAG TPA: YCF48-related protein [Pyrinomonadaceae bacterium]|nr:YCF48-related protein [Pyrinomonadaceae bacterium]